MHRLIRSPFSCPFLSSLLLVVAACSGRSSPHRSGADVDIASGPARDGPATSNPGPPASDDGASSAPGAPDGSGAEDPADAAVAPSSDVAAPQPVSGDDYEGVVFHAADPQGQTAGESRWTPTATDVRETERLLAAGLAELPVSPEYQQSRLPDVVERLAEYRRQYVGIVGEAGERIVWIQLVRDADRRHPEWRTDLVSVRGGGEAYVRLRVSLDTGRCFDLQLNSPR